MWVQILTAIYAIPIKGTKSFENNGNINKNYLSRKLMQNIVINSRKYLLYIKDVILFGTALQWQVNIVVKSWKYFI